MTIARWDQACAGVAGRQLLDHAVYKEVRHAPYAALGITPDIAYSASLGSIALSLVGCWLYWPVTKKGLTVLRSGDGAGAGRGRPGEPAKMVRDSTRAELRRTRHKQPGRGSPRRGTAAEWENALVKAKVVAFRELQIEGKRYTYDVVIERGQIRRRRKGASKPLRDQFGHTPLSVLVGPLNVSEARNSPIFQPSSWAFRDRGGRGGTMK